jgi:hypothetical protein
MTTTISRPRHFQLQVSRLRPGRHILSPQSDRHQHPVRADIPRVMGPANRAPGIPIMGAPDCAGGVAVMGGHDAGPRAYVMGGPDDHVRHDVMGRSDLSFVDFLFTGGITR